MRNLLVAILSILILDLSLTQCANPRSPTGGPKDTIPPTLTSSDPTSGSINFKSEEIILTFSEYINAEKLSQNLIITPKSEIKYKHLTKKNQLSIKLESELADSTTYSLNFFDGVTDITERNPAVNLILAFSTGDYIDSIQLEGTVVDLLSKQPAKKFTVGLYPITDTLDFLSDPPMYFTTTSDSGRFNMSYIKTGDYKIVSFNDANRNLILDPDTEAHGFFSDTLLLESNMKMDSLPTVLQDVRPIKLINNRPIGPYQEIKFSKRIDSYQLSPSTFSSHIVGEKSDVIRIYYDSVYNYQDSVAIQLTVSDSLENTVSDTLKIVFLESNRKKSAMISSIKQLDKSQINPTFSISHNKPIVLLDTSKFLFTKDTLFSYHPDSISFDWNKSRTKLELQAFSNIDTINQLFLNSLPPDTSSTDSIVQQPPNPPLKFVALPSAFVSIEQDTSELISITHKPASTSFGTLNLSLETEETSFIVQLLNSQGSVSYQSKNILTPEFIVSPGNYKVRILIDSNNDGKWSFGNLIRNQEPEEVYLFPEEISVRENWIIEDILITF